MRLHKSPGVRRMQFSKEFFKDEVREGFYVSGMMKRVWAAQLEVLADVAKVCKKHNIRWFADGGTLLGAVRHNGYIPWDDDLDIIMLREDYNRFNQIAKKELPSNYAVINFHTEEKFWELLTRINNGNSIRMDEEHMKKYHGFPFVAGIDIFPLDYIAPKKEEEELRIKMAEIVEYVIDVIDEENKNTKEMEDLLKQVEELCVVKLDRKRPIKLQLYTLLENLFSLYHKKEAKEVAIMPYWIKSRRHKYPLEYFKQTISLPFEEMEINAPLSYEGVLKLAFGDYMKCFKGGGLHEYPLYKAQEDEMISKLEVKFPFRYEFSKDDLENEGRFKADKPKEQVKAFIGLLDEAHNEVVKAIRNQNYGFALQLLESCQEGAIQLGTLIEQLGKGSGTVELLEEYCEFVYQLHEGIFQGQNISADAMQEELKQVLLGIENRAINEIINRKEIVFMPYKASHWRSLESIWKAAVEAGNSDVYVIPIPYFDRNTDGSISEIHYEGNEFPEYVNTMSYIAYSFEKRHPDIVFTNNPYDGSNQFFSVHLDYYSENIKQYTEKLVYVPPYVLDEIGPLDTKSIKSMDYYLKLPGVVHADKVIVQSEKMRQIYIDVMTEFAGEDTRAIWEEKMVGLGSAIFDKAESTQKEQLNLPQSWRKKVQKADGSYKKVVLYHINLGTFLEYEERMLDKMESVLSTFKEQKEEITVILNPHPLILKTCKSIRANLWKQYQELINQYMGEDWFIYDDNENLKNVIALCDAYYGDSDSVAQQCIREKKPVMIQDLELLFRNES